METVNSENSIHNDIINLQDLTEWKLFAEGNANFLFNYIGKDPQFVSIYQLLPHTIVI